MYNGKYIVNLLAGKEIKVRGNNIFSIDVKYTLAGGKRYTPLNYSEAVLQKRPIFEIHNTNDLAFKEYSRFDLKLTYKLNRKKTSHEFYLDIQNLFDTKNIFTQEFDKYKFNVVTQYQLGFNPIINYRIQI